MVATDKVFAGSIPELYERVLVPLLFEAYAVDLAARVVAAHPNDVLETAAGTGVVTRELAAHLPRATRIVSTDLNTAMLEEAARRPVDRDVEWRQADALSLPFEDASFDAVVCQFGVMFFPDKRRGFAEARRVLRRGGRYVFSVWDRLSENAFAETVSDAVAALFPDNPPGFIGRTPYAYYDVERIREELAAAGFTSSSADVVAYRSAAASPRDVAVGFCRGTPLAVEIEARDRSRLEEATDKAAEAVARRFGDGRVEAPMRAFVLTATA